MNTSLWLTLSVVWRLIRSYNLQFHCMWNGHFVLTADITVSRDNLAKSFLISFNTRRHSWQLQVLRAVARVLGIALHQGKSHLISNFFVNDGQTFSQQMHILVVELFLGVRPWTIISNLPARRAETVLLSSISPNIGTKTTPLGRTIQWLSFAWSHLRISSTDLQHLHCMRDWTSFQCRVTEWNEIMSLHRLEVIWQLEEIIRFYTSCYQSSLMVWSLLYSLQDSLYSTPTYCQLNGAIVEKVIASAFTCSCRKFI